MVDADILAALRPHRDAPFKACWIRPDGSVLPCQNLKHFAALGPEIEGRYEDCYKQVEIEVNEFLDDIGPDEHVPWHQIDEEYSASWMLMASLADEGYIRCALSYVFGPNDEYTIFEMDTTKVTAKRHHEVIVDICAALGIERVYLTISEHHSRKRYKL